MSRFYMPLVERILYTLPSSGIMHYYLCVKKMIMEKILEKIESWIADEPTESETQKSSLDIAIEQVM